MCVDMTERLRHLRSSGLVVSPAACPSCAPALCSTTPWRHPWLSGPASAAWVGHEACHGARGAADAGEGGVVARRPTLEFASAVGHKGNTHRGRTTLSSFTYNAANVNVPGARYTIRQNLEHGLLRTSTESDVDSHHKGPATTPET